MISPSNLPSINATTVAVFFFDNRSKRLSKKEKKKEKKNELKQLQNAKATNKNKRGFSLCFNLFLRFCYFNAESRFWLSLDVEVNISTEKVSQSNVICDYLNVLWQASSEWCFKKTGSQKMNDSHFDFNFNFESRAWVWIWVKVKLKLKLLILNTKHQLKLNEKEL